MTDYRQYLVDAAVTELKSQVGEDAIRQEGTHVDASDTFKMARVIEAVINAAFYRPEPEMIETVVAFLGKDEDRIVPVPPEDNAADLLHQIRRIIVDKLDPLP